MVQLINAANREQHAQVISSMHRDRKRVFIDWLKWNLEATGDQEIDQFDTEEAVYLVVVDEETGKHLGSVRLLPSAGPHLLGDVFPELCEGPVPRGPGTWEITRMCVAPHIATSDMRRIVLERLALACIEYGLLSGIDQFTLVTHVPFVPVLLSFAWDCRPLGLPVRRDEVDLCALSIAVDAGGLSRLRSEWNVPEPVLSEQRTLPLAA